MDLFPSYEKGLDKIILAIKSENEAKKTIEVSTTINIGPIESLTFSSDGKFALAGTYWNLKLWNLQTEQETRIFSTNGATFGPTCVAISPDGKYILAGYWEHTTKKGNTIRLWNLATGEEVSAFDGISDSVMAVAFSRDGKNALSGNYDGTVRLWNLK